MLSTKARPRRSRQAAASSGRTPTRAHWTSYLYALPALVFIVGIIHYGIVANIIYSTWNWNGVSSDHLFVGLQNFQKMLADPVFWQALGHTFLFGVIVVFVQLILGFLLAVLVRTRVVGTGILRTVLFVPVVLSGAVVATSFKTLLTPDGAFNQFLQIVGFHNFQQPWLADSHTALLTIAAINIWQFTGYSFVIYDAALGQIDASVIEAARIDGASTFQLLRRVIFPLLNSSHVVLIVLGFIGSLKTFELVALTTGGGPGTTTEFLSTYIYRLAIPQFQAGYAAALSIALVVLALAFALLQVRFTQKIREA